MHHGVSESDIEAWEPALPLSRDEDFATWRKKLVGLRHSKASIRKAEPTARDARVMKDIQVVCSPISVLPLRQNITAITTRRVLLAEIEGVHVGYCISSPGTDGSGLLYLQVVAVAPEAQRRGVGLALLRFAVGDSPWREVVMATQEENTAARALNERLARAVGGTITRVPLSAHRDADLGIQRGMGYRAWGIRREPSEEQRQL